MPSYFFKFRINIIVQSPDLGYSKVFARWLPQILKFTQRSKDMCCTRWEPLVANSIGIKPGSTILNPNSSGSRWNGRHTTWPRKKKFNSAPMPAAFRDEGSIIVWTSYIEQQYCSTGTLRNLNARLCRVRPPPQMLKCFSSMTTSYHTCMRATKANRICMGSGASPAQ